MKNILFALLLFSSVVFSSDSGLYYDQDRGGEGISLHRSGDTIVAFLFTYGGEDPEVGIAIPPYVSPQFPLENPLNGQRWFLISGDVLINDTYATGLLYQGGGINYPVPLVPNGIGDVVVVGEYLLERFGDGWSLIVIPMEGSQLDDDDPLFTIPFTFDTQLFSSGD